MRKVLLSTCLGAAALFADGSGYANQELMKMSQNPKDWVMPAGNYANQRYSTLKQITADNVKNLTPKWTFSTGVLRGHEGAPLVVGDVMFVHTPFPNIVYALDLNNDGKILWKYEPKQDPNVIPVMCCDTVNRGLAYGDGKVFLHQADTTLVALDAKTGKVKWVYQMTPHDEWDYDGVNEMILTDQKIGGQERKLLTHFDRNGFGYTLDRISGELLVAEKFDPAVNWATKVEMDKNSPNYGRPLVVPAMSTEHNGEDVNSKGICPAALGSKDEQPAAYSPQTELFYVPTNHVCMDYEPFKVSYTAGQPYVGATLAMYPPARDRNMGNVIAWDGKTR